MWLGRQASGRSLRPLRACAHTKTGNSSASSAGRAIRKSVLAVICVPGLARGRRYTDRVLPVLLRACRKLFNVREEDGHLPDVVVVKRFVPGGHAGVADAVADHV